MFSCQNEPINSRKPVSHTTLYIFPQLHQTTRSPAYSNAVSLLPHEHVPVFFISFGYSSITIPILELA